MEPSINGYDSEETQSGQFIGNLFELDPKSIYKHYTNTTNSAYKIPNDAFEEKNRFSIEISNFYENDFKNDLEEYDDYDLEDFIVEQDSSDDWMLIAAFISEFIYSQFTNIDLGKIVEISKSFLNYNVDPMFLTGDEDLNSFIINAFSLDIPDLIKTVSFTYTVDEYFNQNPLALKMFLQSMGLILEIIVNIDDSEYNDFDDFADDDDDDFRSK